MRVLCARITILAKRVMYVEKQMLISSTSAKLIRIIRMQIGVTLLVTSVLWLVRGKFEALSACLGGVIAFVPAILYGLRIQVSSTDPNVLLKAHFRAATHGRIREFSVAANRSLDFLEMPGGRFLRGIAEKIFRLRDHSRPSFLNQGYLLITVGEKG